MPDNEQEQVGYQPPVEALPPVIPQLEPQLEAIREEVDSDIDDLFEVPQPDDNDMRTDHLFARPEPEDLSDLFDNEGILDLDDEPEPEPRPTPRRVVRTKKLYRPSPPPPTLGRINQ